MGRRVAVRWRRKKRTFVLRHTQSKQPGFASARAITLGNVQSIERFYRSSMPQDCEEVVGEEKRQVDDSGWQNTSRVRDKAGRQVQMEEGREVRVY